jgi:hypothetical protein
MANIMISVETQSDTAICERDGWEGRGARDRLSTRTVTGFPRGGHLIYGTLVIQMYYPFNASNFMGHFHNYISDVEMP